MAGLESVCNFGKAYALVGEQYEHVVQKVGGFINGLVPIPRLGRECQFDAFLADFLRDSFGAPRNERGRVAFLIRALGALPDYRFEFGNKCDVLVCHCLSPGSDIDLVFGQVLLEVWNRQFGAVENTGRKRTVDAGPLKHVEKMASRTSTAGGD